MKLVFFYGQSSGLHSRFETSSEADANSEQPGPGSGTGSGSGNGAKKLKRRKHAKKKDRRLVLKQCIKQQQGGVIPLCGQICFMFWEIIYVDIKTIRGQSLTQWLNQSFFLLFRLPEKEALSLPVHSNLHCTWHDLYNMWSDSVWRTLKVCSTVRPPGPRFVSFWNLQLQLWEVLSQPLLPPSREECIAFTLPNPDTGRCSKRSVQMVCASHCGCSSSSSALHQCSISITDSRMLPELYWSQAHKRIHNWHWQSLTLLLSFKGIIYDIWILI